MAFDDPIVWVMVVGLAVLLFGSSKIPQLARALGEARKEFDNGWKGVVNIESVPEDEVSAPNLMNHSPDSLEMPVTSTVVKDPLIVAAQSEGIETVGKSREQIASEISWKLNKK